LPPLRPDHFANKKKSCTEDKRPILKLINSPQKIDDYLESKSYKNQLFLYQIQAEKFSLIALNIHPDQFFVSELTPSVD